MGGGQEGESPCLAPSPHLSESKTEAREVQRVAQGHTGRLPGLLSQSFSLLTQVSLGFWRFPSESSPPSGGHITHVTRACFLVSSFNQPPPCHAPAAVNPASCSPGGALPAQMAVWLCQGWRPLWAEVLQEPGCLQMEDPGQGTGGEPVRGGGEGKRGRDPRNRGEGSRVTGTPFYKPRPSTPPGASVPAVLGRWALTVMPLLTPAVQMLDQPHQEPTLTPAIGPATTSARSPPLHPCPGPALHAFFRGRGSGGGVGCGCSVPAGLGFLLASCRAWSTRQRRPPPGPLALLLHVGSTGPPSKSCLPQAGGACEGSGGDPRPEPLHPGRAGIPPTHTSCSESEKRKSIV